MVLRAYPPCTRLLTPIASYLTLGESFGAIARKSSNTVGSVTTHLRRVLATSGLYSRLKYWYAVAPYGADIDDR